MLLRKDSANETDASCALGVQITVRASKSHLGDQISTGRQAPGVGVTTECHASPSTQHHAPQRSYLRGHGGTLSGKKVLKMAWHTPLGYAEHQLGTKLILNSRLRVFSPAWPLGGRLMANSQVAKHW